MLTLIRDVLKGLRKNVLVLKATIAKKENGRRQRKHARSTSRKKMDAKPGTPENTVDDTARRKAHAEPGTPEDTVDNTARKEVLAEVGTPESTAVNTDRRKNANGLKREQDGLGFLTPVEQNGVARDGLGIHVASKHVTEM